MSRLNQGRYEPDETWYTPEEHRALKDELLVMVVLVAVGLLCVFAEPLMDLFMAALGAR